MEDSERTECYRRRNAEKLTGTHGKNPCVNGFKRVVCSRETVLAQATEHWVSTAFKQDPDQILDVWLVVAEYAREAWKQSID